VAQPKSNRLPSAIEILRLETPGRIRFNVAGYGPRELLSPPRSCSQISGCLLFESGYLSIFLLTIAVNFGSKTRYLLPLR
jgi:hypothetical protein